MYKAFLAEGQKWVTGVISWINTHAVLHGVNAQCHSSCTKMVSQDQHMERISLISPVEVMEFSLSLPYFYTCSSSWPKNVFVVWLTGVGVSFVVIEQKGKVVPIGDQILELGLLATLTNRLTQPVRHKIVVLGTWRKVKVCGQGSVDRRPSHKIESALHKFVLCF